MTASGSETLRSLADVACATIEREVTLDQAAVRLAGRRWGVVINAAGKPVGLVEAEYLQACARAGAESLDDPVVGVAPAVVVDGSLTLDAFTDSEAVSLLDVGAPGLVVMSEAGLIGIVPAQILDDFLADRYGSLPSRTQGVHGTADAILPGLPQTGLAVLTCRRPGCGVETVIAFYDPQRPPRCANPELPPHPIQLAAVSQ